MRLKDKVAIITGSGRGLGKSIAELFAKEGAKVVIAEYDLDVAAEVAKQIEEKGGTALAVETDVSNRRSVKNAVDKTISVFGQIDILINNAGTIAPAMMHKMTEEQFDSVIGVHLKGTFNCMQEVIHHMKSAKYGRIINVTSAAGILGTIGQINYSTAKGGIMSMTKCTAREMARHNITANCLAPSAATRMTKTIRTDEKFKEKYLSRIPMERWAEPTEIAPVFLFFASDESSYVTGQVLNVDGGMVM